MKNQWQVKSKTDLTSAKGFTELKVASPWSRLAAQVIDQGLVAFAVISAMSLWFPQKIGTSHWCVTLVLMWILVSTLTQGVFAWFYRNTPGKKSMGLELKSAVPQSELRFTQVIVRSFTWWLGAMTLGAGWSTILSRVDRRAWHDVAADTIVVSRHLPQYPTVIQKRFGEVWLGLLSFAFAFCVVGLLLVEMQGLQGGHSSTSKRFDELSVLNQNSWLIIAGQTFHSVPSGLLVGEDAKLEKLLSLFSQARKLPLSDRYNFYKVNMEEIEDELCRLGHEKLGPCESARLMVELLTPTPSKISYPRALQGLLVLQDIETLDHASDQIRYLENEMRQAEIFSPQYFAYKSLEAKILMKTGDFKRAESLVQEDLKKIDIKSFSDTTFSDVFVTSACQVTGLQDCSFEGSSVCLKKDFWQKWSRGCSAKTVSDLKTAPEVLGYWWSRSKTPEIKKLSFKDWQKIKDEFQNQKADESDADFQKDLFTALDFVINLKTAPRDVFARSKKISPENPLWGWAHIQALEELGDQWRAIIYPIEQKLLRRYGILHGKNGRTLASESFSEERKPRLTPQLTIER